MTGRLPSNYTPPDLPPPPPSSTYSKENRSPLLSTSSSSSSSLDQVAVKNAALQVGTNGILKGDIGVYDGGLERDIAKLGIREAPQAEVVEEREKKKETNRPKEWSLESFEIGSSTPYSRLTSTAFVIL